MYESLMSGLEAVEKNISDVKANMRFDSEYFMRAYEFANDKLRACHTQKLFSLTTWVTQGPNPMFSSNGDIPCLTGRNIAHGRVNYNGADYIDEFEYRELRRFQLKPGDTLITLKGRGSIGKIGYVTETREAIFSRDIGLVRPSGTVEPAYLNAYILSKYGQALVLRGETGGTGQTTLATSYLKAIDVPIFLRIEGPIAEVVRKSESVMMSSQNYYASAEQILLSTLGMADFTPCDKSIAVKMFSESFGASGRLDSEYYQPKYQEYLSKITAYEHGIKQVKEEFDLVKTSFDKTEDYYPYIEIGDINVWNGSYAINIVPTDELPANAKIMVSSGDLLVSKVRPYRGAVTIINQDINNLVVSSAFSVLRQTSDYPIETLSVLLRTSIYKDWFLKWNVGSSYPVIKDEDVLNMPIPLLTETVHKQVTDKIQQSFALRRQSEQLLEAAKRTVEIAIEENEDAAMAWLRRWAEMSNEANP